MDQKLNINYKIALLLISIEALNIYAYDLLNIRKIKNYIYMYIHNIKYKDHNKYLENNMQLIAKIYCLIKQNYIQEITQKILYDYSYRYNSELVTQYLRRYIYIYIKKDNYYTKYNHNDNTSIYSIAIINLYIINQIHQTKGLYTLMKYCKI